MCKIFREKKARRVFVERLMVALEYVVAGWGYYVFTLRVCLETSYMLVDMVLMLVTFHVLFALALWSHTMAVYSPLVQVPPEFSMPEEDWQCIEFDLDQQRGTRERLGIKTYSSVHGVKYSLNYCHQCAGLKPDRCHHCSKCGACVLRMDHHCPWLSRCVGFHNHKYFILFMHYSFVYCFFLVVICAGAMVRVYNRDFIPCAGVGIRAVVSEGEPDTSQVSGLAAWESEDFQALSLPGWEDVPSPHMGLYDGSPAMTNISDKYLRLVMSRVEADYMEESDGEEDTAVWVVTCNTGLSVAFLQITSVALLHAVVLVLLVPLLRLHAYLLASNVTTLEWTRPLGLPGENPSTAIFHLGSERANHQEIMGTQLSLWPVPVFTSVGDGVHFPVKTREERSVLDRAGSPAVFC